MRNLPQKVSHSFCTLYFNFFAQLCRFFYLFVCFLCCSFPYRFQLPCLLKNHMYSVHREKKHSVTCEICGKSFYVKFHLDKHMLSHTDKSERLAQRKQCEHCGEWLMTKSGIYYHEQIHTTGVQKCQQCQAELPNKLALLAHIRQYHRERKFKCSYCDKTFATASVMRVIMHLLCLLFQTESCCLFFFFKFKLCIIGFHVDCRHTKKATLAIMCINVNFAREFSPYQVHGERIHGATIKKSSN